MFDKIKGSFETFSASKESHKDPTLRTITFRASPDTVAHEIVKILTSLKYKSINFNEVYKEIFAVKAGYEVTVNCLNNNGITSVDISVFNPNRRGTTRKALRFLLHEIKQRLAQYE